MHRVQQVPRSRAAGAVARSRCRSCRGPRSACWGRTAPASRRCLRIMAGLDEPSNGAAQLAPGRDASATCRRSRSSTRRKDVRGNVEDGVAEKRALLDRFNEISLRFAEPMSDDEMAALLEEQGEVQDRIERLRRLEPRPHARHRDGCAALPARPTPTSPRCPAASGAGWRCAGCCSPSPDLLLLDEPTNHLDAESVAWLEQFLERFPGTVLAVTHDRYFLDNVAGWILELDRGHGIPFQGNYSSWLEQKQARLARRGEAGVGPPAHAAARAGVGADVAARPPRQVARRALTRLRAAAGRGAERQARLGRDPHPGRRAAGRQGGRGATACARASATGC